jgi:hypothetical protein
MKATKEQLEIAYFELLNEYGGEEKGIYLGVVLPARGALRLHVASQEIFDSLRNPYTTPKLPGVVILLECKIDTGGGPVVLHND